MFFPCSFLPDWIEKTRLKYAFRSGRVLLSKRIGLDCAIRLHANPPLRQQILDPVLTRVFSSTIFQMYSNIK